MPAHVVHVDAANERGPWDGLSWPTAFRRVQDGLDPQQIANAARFFESRLGRVNALLVSAAIRHFFAAASRMAGRGRLLGWFRLMKV